jgi:hypothetical protein
MPLTAAIKQAMLAPKTPGSVNVLFFVKYVWFVCSELFNAQVTAGTKDSGQIQHWTL